MAAMNQVEDVKIILAYNRHYKFHSGTLARNSPLLAEMLTESKAAKLGHKARAAGVNVRWIIQLNRLPDDNEPAGALELLVSICHLEEAHTASSMSSSINRPTDLIVKDLNANGEPTAKGLVGLVVNENGRVPTKIFDYYEAILYAFYNKDIPIRDADMGSALNDSMGMLDVAKYLGCVNIIRNPVEIALTKHGQTLYRSIPNTPAVWAGLALDLQSETIFRESIIHLAGNWTKWRADQDTTGRQHPVIRQIAEKYHRRIMAKAKDLELKIASVYPNDMCKPINETSIKCEEYAKDILRWMALCFFRHWFGQRIVSQRGHFADDGGYELYQQLATGKEAYMDKTVMNQFHSKLPMTPKSMGVVEKHVEMIKNYVKNMVENSGVLANKCQLDVGKYPVGYLTCVDFKRTDYPWLREVTLPEMPVRGDRARRPGGNDISRQQLETARRMQERAVSAELSGEDAERKRARLR